MKRFFSCYTTISRIHLFQKLIDSLSIYPISRRKTDVPKSLEIPVKSSISQLPFLIFNSPFYPIPCENILSESMKTIIRIL